MKLYELNCLISPNLLLEEIESLQKKIKTEIEKKGGFLIEEKNPVKKRVASLKDNNSKNRENLAYLINLTFNLESAQLEELGKELSKTEHIIRYLFLKKKALKITKKRITLPQDLIGKKVETKKDKTDLQEIKDKIEEILGK